VIQKFQRDLPNVYRILSREKISNPHKFCTTGIAFTLLRQKGVNCYLTTVIRFSPNIPMLPSITVFRSLLDHFSDEMLVAPVHGDLPIEAALLGQANALALLYSYIIQCRPITAVLEHSFPT
jgi:hypothetical protein